MLATRTQLRPVAVSCPAQFGARASLCENWKIGVARLFAFFALAFIVAFGLDSMLKHEMRKVNTSYLGALNREMSGRVGSDIVISGSSRGLCSYDPRLLQAATGYSVFNISQDATRTDFQLAFLKTYLKHNAKPRILIQNLDFHSFGLSREIAYPGLYAPYLGEKEIYNAFKKVDSDVWKWKYCPLYCFAVEDNRLTWMLGIGRAFGRNPTEDLVSGFLPENKHWSADFHAWKNEYPDGQTIDFDANGVQVMEDLLTLCQNQKISVILVFAPVYKELNPMVKNRNQIFAEFGTLSRRFGVPFWDYSEAPWTSDTKYFGNSQHLNRAGAELFSLNLAERLGAFVSDSELVTPSNNIAVQRRGGN